MEDAVSYTYILAVLCILILLYFYVYQSIPVKEGLDSSGPQNALDKLSNGFKDIGNKINELPRQIEDKFKGIGKIFTAFPNAFNVLNNKINSSWRNFSRAFPDGFEKLKQEINESSKGINQGFSDANRAMNSVYSEVLEGINVTVRDMQLVFQYIEDFSEFCWKYLYCGLMKIVNLPYCFFFYMMEVVGYVLYMPIVFSVYLIKYYSGCDLQPYLDKFWDFMYCLDDNQYAMTGTYILRFSPTVMRKCFNCDVVPMPTFPADVFVKDYANIHDSITNFPKNMKHAMDGEVIPSMNRLIHSGNASVNVMHASLSKSFNEVESAFKDSSKKFVDDITSAF
jgi:hypothetical protein